MKDQLITQQTPTDNRCLDGHSEFLSVSFEVFVETRQCIKLANVDQKVFHNCTDSCFLVKQTASSLVL